MALDSRRNKTFIPKKLMYSFKNINRKTQNSLNSYLFIGYLLLLLETRQNGILRLRHKLSGGVECRESLKLLSLTSLQHMFMPFERAERPSGWRDIGITALLGWRVAHNFTERTKPLN